MTEPIVMHPKASMGPEMIDPGQRQHATYDTFLHRKAQAGADGGFDPAFMADGLFDFQESLVAFNCRKGRSATFADCGLGKTPMQLTWAQNVVQRENKHVLTLTPLAVAGQTIREADKFKIDAVHSREGTLPTTASIVVANYERLHYFNPDDFAGVVCDESSCLKSFEGARRSAITEFMRKVPYRMLATATAAPNDYIELGTSSEALGYLGHIDMLNRFFKNDQNTSDTRLMARRAISQGGPKSNGWRFKGHAEIPFWREIASWSRALRRPSDIGPFSDDRFILLPLTEREHIVKTRTLGDGMLFPLAATDMREEREERRRTIEERCELAAELVSGTGKPFVVWCELNDEGDLLERLIGTDAVQVSGTDSDEEKEDKYEAFSSGKVRGIVTKQVIGGWGLNWQHCAHVVEFATHSFERHYQGVRRCWRFGQRSPVVNDIIATEGQQGIMANLQRKSAQADRMFEELIKHMQDTIRIEGGYKFETEAQLPCW
jgi:hypothetical protein